MLIFFFLEKLMSAFLVINEYLNYYFFIFLGSADLFAFSSSCLCIYYPVDACAICEQNLDALSLPNYRGTAEFPGTKGCTMWTLPMGFIGCTRSLCYLEVLS